MLEFRELGIYIWAEKEDTMEATESVALYVAATGEVMPFGYEEYLGTVQIDWTVWHVYKRR